MKLRDVCLKNPIKSISSQLDGLLSSSQLPAHFFCHDITFGNGYASLLSSNSSLISHYHAKRPPIVFTNQKGRMLKDGVHLIHYLLDFALEYRDEYHTKLCEDFAFKYILSFAVNEPDCQHLYSFFFNMDEMRFVQHTINQLNVYKQFILGYRNSFDDAIQKACEQFRVDFPVVNFELPDDSLFSLAKDTMQLTSSELPIDRLSVQQAKCFQYLMQGLSAKEIAMAMQLSHRTIEHYIAAIRLKLNCSNVKELMARFASYSSL